MTLCKWSAFIINKFLSRASYARRCSWCRWSSGQQNRQKPLTNHEFIIPKLWAERQGKCSVPTRGQLWVLTRSPHLPPPPPPPPVRMWTCQRWNSSFLVLLGLSRTCDNRSFFWRWRNAALPPHRAKLQGTEGRGKVTIKSAASPSAEACACVHVRVCRLFPSPRNLPAVLQVFITPWDCFTLPLFPYSVLKKKKKYRDSS